MTGRAEAEARVRACYSTWGQSYYEDYYGPDAPYPPVHADLLRQLLTESGAHTVLDAGCGPASFIRDLPEGIDAYGFDVTPEMVRAGQEVMLERGLPADRLWTGSVLDPSAFRSPVGSPDVFDAAVCVGVLPHIPEELDRTVVANLRDAVRQGGLVAVEARNELFALFTLNRYTSDLFRTRLLPVEALREAATEADDVEAAVARLCKMFRTDVPPLREGRQGEPGYDEVLSRTHNPFILREIFEAAGLRDVRVLFYHFHALPPLVEDAAPNAVRRVSLEMEGDPADWRGHFMASAFIVVGTRA